MSVVFLRRVDLNDVCNSNTVADLQVLTTVSVLASFVFFLQFNVSNMCNVSNISTTI